MLSVLWLGPVWVQGQWLTQSISLKAGWNAVYLHVDASHQTIDSLVGLDPSNPIQEVWMWLPSLSTAQFIQSPQLPTDTGSPWAHWNRSQAPFASLTRLMGNAAFLVREGSAPAGYTWSLKGKPVAPCYLWTTTGLNFLGFSTPAVSAPTFDSFLAPAPQLRLTGEFYAYQGGDFGPSNPMRVFAYRTARVERGQALWMRMGTGYNRYFGPFEVALQSGQGVDFEGTRGQHSLRLHNLTSRNLTVTLNLLSSESPPAGQPAILGAPPLLVRGELNLTNLTYGHTHLAGPRSWTLPPAGQTGSELEVVLGLNRSQMGGSPGALHAGILRFTDAGGLSQVDVSVSATVASRVGLWVGGVRVMDVRHYLKTFARDADGRPTIGGGGAYQVTGINTDLGGTARPFPLRLILHEDENGQVVLLQRVFHGLRQGTNEVLATQESLLDTATLASARRLSAAHLPFSTANEPWTCPGRLAEGTNLTATIVVAHNHQASNPFLHTYHPDHDNLNATFDQPLPPGFESYQITRQITLSVAAPPDDFAGLTRGSQTLTGLYEETLTLAGKPGDTREFQSEGIFSLNRISTIPVLTRP
ncbi:MAG: hypothetical protein FJ387_23970 [Verrucomicrobia bacterium]|nr:hypothetical protein [Verrucomicrobiota bacterium]